MRKRILVSKTGKRIKNKYVLIWFSLILLVIIVFLYSGAVANVQAAELPDFSSRKDFQWCPGSGFFCPGIWGDAELLSPPSDRYCINDTLHHTTLCILKIFNPRYTKNPDDTLTIEFEYLVHDYSLVDYHYTSGHTGRVYLNVWIDWDGDKVWEPEEKVIHKCLFPNPSYLHVITIRDTVPIPEKFTNSTWMRIYTSDMRDDKTEPCWLEGGIWGDVYDMQIYIEMPDLRINSSDISIEPYIPGTYDLENPPSIISVTVHNDGDVKAKHVEVKFLEKIGEAPIKKTTKILNEIPAGGSKEISVEWPVHPDYFDIEVDVDPHNKIRELKEDNNNAITHKITGKITDSKGNPLKRVRVEYQENIGNMWFLQWVTFTHADGIYSIFTNMDMIEEGKEGRINCSLDFSPDRNPDFNSLKIRVIDDSVWGDRDMPHSIAPVSKASDTFQMKKSEDYEKNIQFLDPEGGRIYSTLVQCYEYANMWGIAPTGTTRVEINDDNRYRTCYQSGNKIHIIKIDDADSPPRASARKLVSSVGHEYGHVIMEGWSVDRYNAIEEGAANWASCVCRGKSIYTYYKEMDIDLSVINQTNGDDPPQFQLAGTMWYLYHLDYPYDMVLLTLKDDISSNLVKDFYSAHKDNVARSSLSLKGTFKAHGYNTTGWPGKHGQDPDFFTGVFSDSKIDTDGDEIAEYLRTNVEVNISTDGAYIVAGSVRGMEFGASNTTYLTAGIQNVSLDFYGEHIFESGLNGPYNISVYLYDENFTFLDHRIGKYFTKAYNFTEFKQPYMLFTGNFSDFGVDTDGDGLYDYLVIGIEVNVSEAEDYEIHGNLYSSENFIDGTENFTLLYDGIQNIQLTFNGVTIYASGFSGPYTLKSLNIPGAYEINTSAYNFTDFQRPCANIEEIVSDVGLDSDDDGLYNQLAVNISINGSQGYYSLSGYLYDNLSRHISSTYNSTYLSSKSNLQLNFDGIKIRNEEKDGPYKLVVKLYDDEGALLGTKTSTTSFYNYTQFQIAPEDYLDITYADYGADPDGNGLYDYLTVDMNVSTIKPGNYRVDGYLYDENDSFVAHDAITSYIDEQPRRVQLNFIGQRIWSTHILNGNYTLELLIYDDNSTRVAELMSAYVTSPYDYTEFEGAYIQSVSDYGVDRDNNGLYEQVVIEALIGTNVARNVTVKGELYDANENKITAIQNLTYVDVGTQPVLLHFDGVIFKNRMDGSYGVKLSLKDEDDNVLDSRSYETSVYNSSDFQRLIELTGYYSDNGTDTDGDGFFDDLTIDIGVFVTNFSKPLNLSVTRARLVDHRGEEIARAENTTMLQDGDQTILLSFNGTAIYEHRVAGPYYLWDVYIYHTAEPHHSDFARDAYTTKAYNYSDFGENLYLPPVADAGGPYAGFDWQPITFDGSRSYDPEGMPLTYYWDFGDGTNGTGVSLTHIYAQEGTYNVSLIVRDATQNSTPYTTTATIEKGTFLGETSDSGVDTDSDGLYNFLSVEVQITSLLARDIILKVKIFDGQGNLISETQGSNNLDVGSYLVTIDFDGSTVFGHGEDGPYIVGLVLEDVNEKVRDNKNHTTSAYNYTDFQL